MKKLVPDMTYNVFGGTLNPAQSIKRPNTHVKTAQNNLGTGCIAVPRGSQWTPSPHALDV